MTGFRTVPGSPDSPVILHVPHSARRIPEPVRERILLDDAALARELDRMTDTGTARLAHEAADAAADAATDAGGADAARSFRGRRGRPWIFENLLSRLVVDPERFPDEREEMRAVGMGAVYTRTSHREPLRAEGSAHDQHARELIAEYFDPYARAVTDLVEDRLATTGSAVIIDVHSYPSRALPYELHAAGARPAVCLGTDTYHTPAHLLDAARTAFRAYGDIALNSPFSGCYVPLSHYRSHPEVSALMLEIRRDTYLAEPAGPPTPGFDALVTALAALCLRYAR